MRPKLLNQTFMSAPFGYAYHKIIVDKSGKPADYEFLEVNPIYEELSGLKSSDILYCKATTVFQSINAEKINLFGQVALKGGVKEFDYYSELLNCWYKVQVWSPEKNYFVTAFYEKESNPTEIELENVSQKIIEEEESINALLNSVDDPVVLIELNGTILEMNDALGKEFGKTKSEMIGKCIYDYLPSEIIENRRKKVQEVINSGKPRQFEDIRNDKIIFNNVNPIFNSEGKVTRLAIFGRNMTHQKMLEQDLKTTHEVLKANEELSKTGGWEFNVEKQKMIWTDQVFRIHGLNPSEIHRESEEYLERSLSCYNSDDRRIVLNAFNLCIEKGIGYDMEFPFTKFNGEKIWIRTTGKAILNENKVERVIGNIIDITERKETELALKKAESVVRNKLNALLEPEGDISNLALSDIIDVESLQSMMNDFYELTKIGIGILDNEGNVLVGTGWQDICTKFHRVNPGTNKNCYESDTILSNGVPIGTFKAYKCKNNLWDISTPIEVGGNRIGNIFLGQFFYDDEIPDYNLFRKQAIEFGFNEEEYIAALERVPRWNRETVNVAMTFYSKLSIMVSMLSISKLKHAKILAEKDRALNELIKFRTISDKANYGAVLINPEFKLVYINETFANMHGWKIEELINKDVSILHSDEQVIKVNKLLEKLSQGSGFAAEEIWNKKRDGSIFPTLMNGTLIKDSENNLLYFSATVIDISDHYLVRQALEESEERFRKVFEKSPVGMALVGKDFLFISVNQAFSNMMKYSPVELIGRKFVDITHPDNIENDIENVKKILSNEQNIYKTDKRYITKDRQIVWGEIIVTRINGKSGEFLYLLAMVTNITERKLSEIEINRINEQLKELNITKDKFFSLIAHDLKSPFSNILGLSSLLQDKAKFIGNSEIEKFSGLINISATQAYRLLENLLDWARMQQGKIEFKPSLMILFELVNDVCDLIIENAMRKKISILNMINENIIVYADESMLNTTIRNLISNAVKFTHSGGFVELDAKELDDIIEISIKDNGVGISTDIKEQLFKIGSNVSTRGTENERGTGLGLVLCKEFIDKHNGKIWVESEVGKGTTFYFSLPTKKAVVNKSTTAS